MVIGECMDTLAYKRDGAVGWLRLNRPDRLNAQTETMWSELAKLGSQLRADPHLRVLVVIGQGRAFSTGIDLDGLKTGRPVAMFGEAGAADEDGSTRPSTPRCDWGSETDPIVQAILGYQDGFEWLAEVPFPTIAAVRGFALGAGFQLALACDLRIVARGSIFGVLEHRYGLVPDLGATWRLAGIVGAGRAKELIFTAETIDADEAFRIGLANRLCDDADLELVVAGLAEHLAGQPPIAMRHSKALLESAGREEAHQSRVRVAAAQADCVRSRDFVEAVDAVANARRPCYENR